MLQLLNAGLTAQALHVVAALGIADRLAGGPAAIDDLAAATGAHQPSLYRLLQMLVGLEPRQRGAAREPQRAGAGDQQKHARDACIRSRLDDAISLNEVLNER